MGHARKLGIFFTNFTYNTNGEILTSKGQPLYEGNNSWSQSVLYSEVPRYNKFYALYSDTL